MKYKNGNVICRLQEFQNDWRIKMRKNIFKKTEINVIKNKMRK